ncbi:hypothetical protein ACFZA9_12135 [Streptomyces olivaceus]|uniref:hypothetical protein n=1 Tax=Streptomyces olivaceus TaxID=47716 RepID=UPI0036E8C27F
MNRRNVNHTHAAARLRADRGAWLTVSEYRNASTAHTIAYAIRSGRNPNLTAYLPAGSFEARTRLTADGTVVEARYVGAADEKCVRPSADAVRVLGQIERGEIRCGADAAREIAASHQAAYGDAVWGMDEDAAWADAVASLGATA